MAADTFSDQPVDLNSRKAWIAVVGSTQTESDFETQDWWCMPVGAKAGDLLLAYRPQRADPKRFGIFALSKIVATSESTAGTTSPCSKYGKHLGELHHTKTEFMRRLACRLTMREMKADPVISHEICVIRNFQGTTFEVTPAGFARILELTDPKGI